MTLNISGNRSLANEKAQELFNQRNSFSSAVEVAFDINQDGQVSQQEISDGLFEDRVRVNENNQLTVVSEAEPVEVNFPSARPNRPNNPETFQERTVMPTPGSIPMDTVNGEAFDANSTLAEAISVPEGTSPADIIQTASARADAMVYEGNSVGDTLRRRSVSEVWETQNDDGQPWGECSDIHNFATYMLNQHGIDAYTAQVWRTGGPHNFTVFQDPESGRYNIMEYGRLFTTDSATPEDAVRQFQNDSVGTIHKYVLYNPTEDAEGFEVRSFGLGRGPAVLDNWNSNPNLDFGIEGLGDGFRLTSQQLNGVLQNVRAAYSHTDDEGVTHTVQASYDDPSQMGALQYGRYSDRYNWWSAGLMAHGSTIRDRTEERNLHTAPFLVPYFAGGYGHSFTLGQGESENSRWQLTTTPNFTGRLALPLGLSAETNEIVEGNQNGNGVIDAGQLVGFSDFTPGLDTTFNFESQVTSTQSISVEAGHRLAYYPLYDFTMIYRDPSAFMANIFHGNLSSEVDLDNGTTLNLGIGGQYAFSNNVADLNRIDMNVGLTGRDNRWSIAMNSGVSGHGEDEMIPNFGATGHYMFNNNVGIMGHASVNPVDNEAIRQENTNFLVGTGLIIRPN